MSEHGTSETERVTQLWPVTLKDEVRKLVGPRGITAFTLDAVRQKLSTHKGAPSSSNVQQDEEEPVRDIPPVRLQDAAENEGLVERTVPVPARQSEDIDAGF